MAHWRKEQNERLFHQKQAATCATEGIQLGGLQALNITEQVTAVSNSKHITVQ